MCWSWEDYGKNWMHFVYKLDHLFQSTSVSDENSSVTKPFHFFWNFLNSRLFVHSICTIQSHILKFEPFLTSFAIFHAFNDLFLSKWPWKWKASTKELKKGWNLAWYHHFTHITYVQMLQGYDKNWMHFVYKLDHLFRSVRV